MLAMIKADIRWRRSTSVLYCIGCLITAKQEYPTDFCLRMPLGTTSKFGVIYFMVLIGFSQLLYLSTNKQNTGMATFIQAVQRGFNATLKQGDEWI